MAKPRTDDRAQTNLRVDRELLARLDRAAAERAVGRNWLICKLLAEGLERLRPPDEFMLVRKPDS